MKKKTSIGPFAGWVFSIRFENLNIKPRLHTPKMMKPIGWSWMMHDTAGVDTGWDFNDQILERYGVKLTDIRVSQGFEWMFTLDIHNIICIVCNNVCIHLQIWVSQPRFQVSLMVLRREGGRMVAKLELDDAAVKARFQRLLDLTHRSPGKKWATATLKRFFGIVK